MIREIVFISLKLQKKKKKPLREIHASAGDVFLAQCVPGEDDQT